MLRGYLPIERLIKSSQCGNDMVVVEKCKCPGVAGDVFIIYKNETQLRDNSSDTVVQCRLISKGGLCSHMKDELVELAEDKLCVYKTSFK
jgi:hypothetical protein